MSTASGKLLICVCQTLDMHRTRKTVAPQREVIWYTETVKQDAKRENKFAQGRRTLTNSSRVAGHITDIRRLKIPAFGIWSKVTVVPTVAQT